jgi:hypothetical protein
VPFTLTLTYKVTSAFWVDPLLSAATSGVLLALAWYVAMWYSVLLRRRVRRV